ncbi:MAG: TMEM14 family protein [Cyanobacteria bacterium P01_D01_bin.36]
MNISIPPLLTLIYGILSIVGGAIGYKQAGSQVSLISGFISGLLLLISAYLLYGGVAAGPLCAAVVTLVLIVVFGIRLVKTRKFMPAGLMIIVGVANLISLWSLFSAV